MRVTRSFVMMMWKPVQVQDQEKEEEEGVVQDDPATNEMSSRDE
jgi:hypothetical protein